MFTQTGLKVCRLAAFGHISGTIAATSRITAVTVYPDGARPTREVSFTAPAAGRHELLVTDLPYGSDPGLIRLAPSEGLQLGAFNLRNHIIPLVDLSVWLDKDRCEDEDSKVIVTEFNNVTTAFQVSGVNRIHRISWEQVEPPNKYVAAVSNNTVIGVVKLEDRIIFLLDLEKVVANLNPKLGLRLDDLGEDWTNEGYRALVADDSALIREMQRDLLEKAGFTVGADDRQTAAAGTEDSGISARAEGMTSTAAANNMFLCSFFML